MHTDWIGDAAVQVRRASWITLVNSLINAFGASAGSLVAALFRSGNGLSIGTRAVVF